MEKSTFSCKIGTSNADVPLGMEVWIDDQKIFDQEHVFADHHIDHEFDDDDGEHELRFVLKNKLSDHTKVDQDNKIISDATLFVSNIRFEDVSCQQIVYESAKYQHDFNGTGAPIIDKFYGAMGCNGTVTVKFTTPIYLWLLENM
jgi:hypothetical protein